MATTGGGRTHLFLGQVDPVPSPASAAAELYVLSAGYGAGSGTSAPLVVETPDIAPLGLLGRWRARLLTCPVRYSGACTIRFTPIADYMVDMEPTTVTLADPGNVTTHAVQVKMLRACTILRLRIDVIDWTGTVESYTPMLYYVPLKAESGMALDEEPGGSGSADPSYTLDYRYITEAVTLATDDGLVTSPPVTFREWGSTP